MRLISLTFLTFAAGTALAQSWYQAPLGQPFNWLQTFRGTYSQLIISNETDLLLNVHIEAYFSLPIEVTGSTNSAPPWTSKFTPLVNGVDLFVTTDWVIVYAGTRLYRTYGVNAEVGAQQWTRAGESQFYRRDRYWHIHKQSDSDNPRYSWLPIEGE